MLVITADLRSSRGRRDDPIPAAIARLREQWQPRLRSPIARFAGDEIQIVADDSSAVLEIVLQLTRTHDWSVGLGIGDAVISQDPAASNGGAFHAARRAVGRAKRAPVRVAIDVDATVLEDAADDLEAMLWLLVTLRDRRTREGWEVVDLLAAQSTQREIADALGISASAVSARAVAAGIRVESSGRAALERMLGALCADATRGSDA